MHLERATRLATPHDDVRELLRVLGRLRWRLGLERALLFALRGTAVSAVLLAILSVIEWLTQATLPLALAALPLLGALLLAIVRWPSTRQAAQQADHRLRLAERLGTAIELIGRAPAGRFDRLQVRDATMTARSAPSNWLALDRRLSRDVLIVLAALGLALGSRLLVELPRPLLPGADEPPAAQSAEATDADRTLPDQALQGLSPLPMSAADQPVAPPRADPDLAAHVQQAQAERDSLDQLANALGQVSAGQPAADAIKQGDFSTASNELNHLGQEADQLSDAAKQQLAQALQTAANTTTNDRQLANSERQATQALSRGMYADQSQALQQLGQQIQRSGAQSVPADQLAREVGQLQQQQGGGTQRGGGGSTSGNAQNGQAGAAAGSSGQGSGGSGDGQQGGPGVGTGSGGNPLGDPNPRLDTAGQRVDVPTKLGQGPGVRPPNGSEDQTGADPSAGARSVAESSIPQQTGQVAPEQNLVPGEQRPVVRGYFR